MLQKSPMYAYIPAKDVGRARKFYEGTPRTQSEGRVCGRGDLRVRQGHGMLPVPDSKRRHFPSQPGVLAGRRR